MDFTLLLLVSCNIDYSIIPTGATSAWVATMRFCAQENNRSWVVEDGGEYFGGRLATGLAILDVSPRRRGYLVACRDDFLSISSRVKQCLWNSGVPKSY